MNLNLHVLNCALLLTLTSCTVNENSKNTKTVTSSKYECTLVFKAKFFESYKDIPVDTIADVTATIISDPYIDKQWESDDSGLFLNILDSSEINIVVPGYGSIEAVATKVETTNADNPPRDNVSIYTKIVTAPQYLGGVLQEMPPLLNFTDSTGTATTSDELPTTDSVWNSFSSNRIYLTNPRKSHTYIHKLTVLQVPDAISVTSCGVTS